MKKFNCDKLISIVFLTIIFSAIALWVIRDMTGANLDVALNGYTDTASKPEISYKSYLSGDLQDYLPSRIDSVLPLRGYLVKTYNTIRYYCFNTGNMPMGENGWVFEPLYLYCTNSVGYYDCSSDEKNREIQEMVGHMVSVNSKLECVGKKLLIAVAPSKSTIYPEEMPKEYSAMHLESSVNSVELFREKISATQLPNIFFADYLPELEYPPFYPTGIHWSRSFEQYCSRELIGIMGRLTDKNYRNFYLNGVEMSSTPFWRDADVYDVLNIWGYPELTYYRYNTSAPREMGVDDLNFLLYGDSFGEGIIDVIDENLPDSRIALINRDDYSIDFYNRFIIFGGDWGKLDLKDYLDTSDVVIAEMTEPEICACTYGFIQYLDGFLDTYVPKMTGATYPVCFDGSSDEYFDKTVGRGFYWKETGYAWVKPLCRITLRNDNLISNGLEISYFVPGQVFPACEEDTVSIYLNGKLATEKHYSEGTHDKIIIPKEKIEKTVSGLTVIEIETSGYFNPAEIGESVDNRDLALRIEYIGARR